ncbi:hypothetical protein, partial [Clostridium perfringens]
VNLDYFKVFSSESNSIVNKNNLQTSIEDNSNRLEKNYTEETWKQFKEAYINAIKVMNDDNVKDENIKIATNTLNQAALGLKEKPLTTPPDVGDARVEAIGIESSTLMLRWTLVPDAASYNVYRVDNLTGEEILLTNTTSLYY